MALLIAAEVENLCGPVVLAHGYGFDKSLIFLLQVESMCFIYCPGAFEKNRIFWFINQGMSTEMVKHFFFARVKSNNEAHPQKEEE